MWWAIRDYCPLLFVLAAVLAKVQHEPGTPLPTFGDPIRNITVVKDRDITFTCIVKHLGQYKVGWVKADTKAIQAIHHQVVTHNPRVKVTYRDKTWNLHIKSVQEDDRGVYMCQVNTDPMIAVMAYLEVIVPPEILDQDSSGETEIEEGGSVTLKCKAKGHPTPEVSWQREGGKKIVLRDQGAKKVSSIEGENLVLMKVNRKDMGPYLCIAKNGVPPSVSKRIMLKINFKPKIEVPVHMMGSPIGKDVAIACYVESSPRAANTWKKTGGSKPAELMLISSTKYEVRERNEGFYKTKMQLIIKNFTKEDTTNYICSSGNSLGFSESQIQVYDLPPPIKDIKSEEIEEDTNLIIATTNRKEKSDFALQEESHKSMENLKNLRNTFDKNENLYDSSTFMSKRPAGSSKEFSETESDTESSKSLSGKGSSQNGIFNFIGGGADSSYLNYQHSRRPWTHSFFLYLKWTLTMSISFIWMQLLW